VVVMRASMLEVMNEPFVNTARAKGVPLRLVRTRHVVPNALLPTIALIFLNFGFVIGGEIVIETVFSWPGIGLLTYSSINSLDYPVLGAVFLLSSAAIVFCNLIADLLLGYLDPRVRLA
jgi:peptide/nickel transport system permease protein